MARGEQDPGLVLAAVAWVEAAQALAEAARGVGGPVAVGQVGAGACGSPSAVAAELARDPEARAVRVRVEEPEQGAARAALVGEPGVEAAVAWAPAGVVVPVEDLVGPLLAREGLQAVGGPERAFLENG
jgi:hypothetical protein